MTVRVSRSLNHFCYIIIPTGIVNFNDVYQWCEPVRYQWDTLATYLPVDRPAVNAIRRDGKDCNDCLQKLLDVWLKRLSPDQPLPSWCTLCEALARLDRNLSKELSSSHPCQCITPHTSAGQY